MYKIKNLTYSPLRVMIGNTEITFRSRKYTYIKEKNIDLIRLEKRGLIKIRKV
jgi:hypothetical protein